MRITSRAVLFLSSALVAGLLGLGCGGANSRLRAEKPTSEPLELASSAEAWEAAVVEKLPALDAGEETGLHNVYRLGERIISGSEPEGDEALAALAAMGVRTILSVDGKVPDVEAAARHGLRYVHLPIRYRGITPREFACLTKTFREAEGPFYVHCFHGRHRGPAAAAVGRVVLDGVDRHLALAEMRQWCGTAEKYAGLYHDVATRQIPTGAAVRALDWDLPSRVPLGGYRHAMIDIVRASDALRMLRARGWTPNPAHPDVDPVNEADKLAGLFERSNRIQSVRRGPRPMAERNAKAAIHARRLHRLLVERRAGRGDEDAIGAAFDAVQKSCKDCHAAYRNE